MNASPTITARRLRWKPQAFLPPGRVTPPAPKRRVQGSALMLASLAFNLGDVWMVIACLLYAGYALGLRKRPAVPAIVYFAATAAVACVVSLPLVAAEIAMGQFFMPTAKGVALTGLRNLYLNVVLIPGRCPGLSCLAPSGPQTELV